MENEELKIKKRNGDFEDFNVGKIKSAILKTCDAINEIDKEFIDEIVQDILKDVISESEYEGEERPVGVETIQNIVERNLMKAQKFEVAKSYILYREKKSQERQRKIDKLLSQFDGNKLKVTKSSGTKELFDVIKIKNVFDLAVKGHEKFCSFEELIEGFKKNIIEDIKTSDINKLLVKTCIDLISVENIHWQNVAARFSLFDLYKKATKNRNISIEDLYTPKAYKDLFDDYVNKNLYYKDFYKYYSEEDILEAGAHLKKEYDWEYGQTTVSSLIKRYLLNPNKAIFELPQEMYMSVALFLAIPEKKETRLKLAKKIYDYCSTQKISLPTPTLMNARTNYHQLSSCFKLNIDDDLRSIYHNVENMAQISKFGGGIGVYIGNIRSKGGSIRNIKGAAGGVNPWIKVINDTAIAVNQLGARNGSISVTLDVWHRDIYDFLDLQTETGDIRRKAYDVFPSVSFPDLFMKRVQNNENWTLFDPKEVKDTTGRALQDSYGEEFEKFYVECESDSRLELKESVPAKELFKKFLKTTVETGMPYTFFRDTVNRLNPNKHSGMIYSSQLCMEIGQNTSPSKFVEEELEDGKIVIKYTPGDSVVCNLASINVAKVNKDKDIKEIIPIAMKVLDNVIDLNFYPIKESEITAKKYRSVGLGFLGLAEYLAVNKIAYDSQKAREKVDELFEKYAYETLKSSMEISKEKGAYELFKGSDWEKGILFGKNEDYFKEHSKMSDKWSELIKNIKEHGLRFAYNLAPAPNTSTALLVGTTASVLPIYKKYFIETNKFASSVNVAPNLNSENFWFYKEYVNMNMNDVIDMMSIVYKWIDQSISFEWIINPERTSPAELYSYYMKAWSQGIKTVYYVRSMSLETKECVSCSG